MHYVYYDPYSARLSGKTRLQINISHLAKSLSLSLSLVLRVYDTVNVE